MPKKPKPLECEEAVRRQLESMASSRTEEVRMVQRARMILGCLDGRPVARIAEELGTRSNTVIAWRQRFERSGLAGLRDAARPGKPVRYGAAFRQRLLELLEQPPPQGQSRWDGPAAARALGVTDDAVWRMLRKEGICLSRQRSWCVSTDPEFTAKSANVVGLYLNPPQNALVISVDEKPSIQALERATGYVQTDSGKIVRGFKSTYRRHGTLNLFAALEVATGAIHTRVTTLKRRVEFLEFMDQVVAELPADKEIYVILDNYCIHKRNDAWLAKHPNVFFHFTPTSASWLNLVEVWFGILTRKALRGANFHNVQELLQGIQDFIEAYSPTAKPFIWRKREIKGSQLRNTIVNLCN